MGMAAEHDIHVAVLHDGGNVLAGQIILERMVHGNNAEVSLLGIVGCKIRLEPVERLVYNGLGCRIRPSPPPAVEFSSNRDHGLLSSISKCTGPQSNATLRPVSLNFILLLLHLATYSSK